MRKLTVIALVVMSSLIGLFAVSINVGIWSHGNKSEMNPHPFEPKRSSTQAKSHVRNTDDFNSSRLLEKAQNGDLQAQYELGLQYQSRKAIEPDKKKASYWYLKAAEQGLREVQTRIGVAYLGGKAYYQTGRKELAG